MQSASVLQSSLHTPSRHEKVPHDISVVSHCPAPSHSLTCTAWSTQVSSPQLLPCGATARHDPDPSHSPSAAHGASGSLAQGPLGSSPSAIGRHLPSVPETLSLAEQA